MKHLSNIEKLRILAAAINNYFTLPHKEGLSISVHRINTTDVRMMAVLGTNYQDGYVDEHIHALMNFVKWRCNATHKPRRLY